MTQKVVGYKLLDGEGETVYTWGGTWGARPAVPNVIRLPNGDHVHCPALDIEYGATKDEEGNDIQGTGYTLVEWWMDEPPPAPPVIPEEISDRQFFQQLAIMQVITTVEALAAVKTGEIPAALQAFIATIEDEGQRFAAEMTVSGAVTFRRSHPLTQMLAAGMGWTSEQVDGLWAAAAEL